MGHAAGSRARYSKPSRRGSGVTPGMRLHMDARYVVANRIAEALDPTRAPGEVRTMAQIDEKTMQEIRKRYERPQTKPKGGTP